MSYLLRLMALVVLGGLLVTGCRSSEDASDDHDSRPSRAEGPAQPFRGLALAPADTMVRSIQLYRRSEATLPIAEFERDGTATSDPLTLEFDLLGSRARALSIFFYHADRTWQRDLSPAEYLDAFQQDNLIDYQNSRATEVHYVHYEYSFPNETIQFRVSGNYIVRVTEQGDEDAVLLERPFFIAEGEALTELQLSQLMVGGGSFPALQPRLLFSPPSSLGGGLFDLSTCFVRNGEWREAKCSDRTPRNVQSGLQFELPPTYAFEAEPANFVLDIADIEVGARITGVDRSARPYRLRLEPDYASFTGRPSATPLNGQSVISDAPGSVEQADTHAEYVDVVFSYVPPDEERLFGPVRVAGSFNEWEPSDAHRLQWNETENWYEGTLLIKQGLYEYRYVSSDPRHEEALRNNLPPRSSLFTAFVYYDDVSVRTDRLVGVATARPGFGH